MTNYLPLLFLLACPLMMVFMMRGMGHDHKPTAGHQDEHQAGIAPANADERDQRLAELEREVAELRASRDQTDTRRP